MPCCSLFYFRFSSRFLSSVSCREILRPRGEFRVQGIVYSKRCDRKCNTYVKVLHMGTDSLGKIDSTLQWRREHFVPQKLDTRITFALLILLPFVGSPYLTDDWSTALQIGFLHALGLFYYWLCFRKLNCLLCRVDIMNHFASGSKFTLVWMISFVKWEYIERTLFQVRLNSVAEDSL